MLKLCNPNWIEFLYAIQIHLKFRPIYCIYTVCVCVCVCFLAKRSWRLPWKGLHLNVFLNKCMFSVKGRTAVEINYNWNLHSWPEVCEYLGCVSYIKQPATHEQHTHTHTCRKSLWSLNQSLQTKYTQTNAQTHRQTHTHTNRHRYTHTHTHTHSPFGCWQEFSSDWHLTFSSRHKEK